MEGKKRSGSSFASDLFGTKDSSSAAAGSSSGIGSIFEPPARVVGREWLRLSETEKKKNGSGGQSWSARTGVSDNKAQGGLEHGWSMKQKDFCSYYQDEQVDPFHYNSSIYYGGQDVYSPPQSAQNPVLTTFTKEIGEDDKGIASRGNWWQGSLYY